MMSRIVNRSASAVNRLLHLRRHIASAADSSSSPFASSDLVLPADFGLNVENTAGNSTDDHYDLIVVGGGSGGIACSKEAAKLGAKVLLVDYVKPSPFGSTWGLGGTCVNVGCIPKKLFHRAAMFRDDFDEAAFFGWNVQDVQLDWSVLVQSVQDHIKGLNFGYRNELRKNQVTYLNALAKFKDQHTLAVTDVQGKERFIQGDKFVIAVGGRPSYPTVEGAAQHCITSDDLFSLTTHPGKTLVIGGSYVALECAGFLGNLGADTTLMVRSIFLRGFDQQMADLAASSVARVVKILRPAIPLAFHRADATGRIQVTYKLNEQHEEHQDEFDTVLLATGRHPDTKALGLDRLGVALTDTGKIVCKSEQSSVSHIYAVGDCVADVPELTPVAIEAGKLLARRLYGNSAEQMDYSSVPTCVFTPTEYACVGLSEEQALKKYGADDVEVYHVRFQPLERTLNYNRMNEHNYYKLICRKSDNERVVGIHLYGDQVGEQIQGFALALKMGVHKSQLEELVGIHPTAAEELPNMNITKRSGLSETRTGC